MKTLLPLFFVTAGLMALAAPALAHHGEEAEDTGAEAALVQCIYDKDPAAARAIKDAPGEEEFLAALEAGAALCSTELKGLSLGRLFKKLNELVPDGAEIEEEPSE